MKLKVYENDKSRIQLKSLLKSEFPFVALVGDAQRLSLIGYKEGGVGLEIFTAVDLKSGFTHELLKTSWVYPLDAELTYK